MDTVAAQLLYEIAGPRYANPDVTARFDTCRLSSDGPDRVRITGTRGEPPPPTLKVGVNRPGGYRNEATFVLTGLDIDAKADLVKAQMADRVDVDMTWSLARTDHPDAPLQEEASAMLHCVVRGDDPKPIGRPFTGAAIEIALGSYPGFHVTAPPSAARPYGVFEAISVDAIDVPHVVVLADGTRIAIDPPGETKVLEATSGVDADVPLDVPSGPTRTVPLGRVALARSGDKGGGANIGVWVRSDEAFAWLRATLTVEKLQTLLPETAELDVTRHVFANLRAVNFVIDGILGEGVSSNARFDPQAKALGEWLRSRHVDIPEVLL